MTKTKFVKKLGQLLRETRSGADIENIYLDEDMAVIVYRDPCRMRRRVNIAADSRIQMIKDVIEAIE